MLFADNAPLIPLFPGPDWGEFNTMRFTDFPSEENPYALLAGYENPERLIQLTTIKPGLESGDEAESRGEPGGGYTTRLRPST